MGKRTASRGADRLGKSIMRARFKQGAVARDSSGFVHSTELDDGYDWGRLQSVTEQGDLDEFLTTAELAGTEFVAEKLNVQVVTGDYHSALLSPEQQEQQEKLYEENKDLLTVPRRPEWDEETTAEELQLSERESFLEWRRQLAALQDEKNLILTPFERNLEVWRQLWRVIERSHVIVQIVDARNPLLFRCSDLEKYVKEISKKKKNLLLINKADMLTDEQRELWKNYFVKENIPFVFWSASTEQAKIDAEAELRKAEELSTAFVEKLKMGNSTTSSLSALGLDAAAAAETQSVFSQHSSALSTASTATLTNRQKKSVQKIPTVVTNRYALAQKQEQQLKEKLEQQQKQQEAKEEEEQQVEEIEQVEEVEEKEKKVEKTKKGKGKEVGKEKEETSPTTAATVKSEEESETAENDDDDDDDDDQWEDVSDDEEGEEEEGEEEEEEEEDQDDEDEDDDDEEEGEEDYEDDEDDEDEDFEDEEEEEEEEEEEQPEDTRDFSILNHMSTTHIFNREELFKLLRSLAPPASKRKHADPMLRRANIGLVGYPNVGKSSTINALLGEKKVAVSATPGKTKHFQTILVDEDICLCDCPGLVFPSFLSTKAEMVCNGMLPIDQLREYVGPVALVCQRIPRSRLESIYGIKLIKPAEGEDPNRPPTAHELLHGYGFMRGFMTAHGSPDEPRSARYILKDYVKGKLLYCSPPPSIDAASFNKVDPNEISGESHSNLAASAKVDISTTPVSGPRHNPKYLNQVDQEFFNKAKNNVSVVTRGTYGGKGLERASHIPYLAPEGSAFLSPRSEEDIRSKRHNNKNKREKTRRLMA